MTAVRSEKLEQRLRLAESISIAARACVLVLLVAGAWVAKVEMGRVKHTNAVIAELDAVERTMLRARVQHRTFVLTGDSAAFTGYRAAAARSDSALTRLGSLVGGDTAQAQRLAALAGSLARLTTLRTSADSVSQFNHADSGWARLNAPERVALRATIDSSVATMLRAEHATLVERSVAQYHIARLLIGSSLLAAILAGVVGISTLRYRRKSSGILAESEATFRRLSDGNPDGVLVHAEDMRIVYANTALATMLRESPESLVGRRVGSIVHPDDRADVAQRAESVMRDGVVTPARTLGYLRSDGTRCDVEARGAPMVFEGQRAVQVVVRDLTERNEAEKALHMSRQRFRALLDAMDEGVVLQDDTLAIQLWNPAAERILGLTSDQIAGRTSYDPTWRAVDETGKELAGDQHFAAIALRTGRPSSGTMGVESADQARIWIHVNAVPLFHGGAQAPYAVVVTFADVTVRREATARLRDSESRYRMLADNSLDLISRLSPDSVIEYASPSHLQILGWSPEELIGRSAVGMIHPEDRGRLQAARELERSTGNRELVTTRIMHKDGHYVWLELASTVLTGPDGTAIGVLVSGRDVTARLALEDELRQSQKMEVMGRMASGIAHDFNNLLTVIRSSTELIRLDRARVGVAADVLGDIEGATDRAAALTAHLLTFSRRQHYSPARLQIAKLVRDAVPILKRLVGDKVTVELDVADACDATWIWGDPVRFEQVLVNLVGNAKDAMPEGGTVRIVCETIALQESVSHRFGVIRPGRYLTLTVEDTGTGMTSDVLTHLFDPFYTTKPQGRGTGLGLSIVYGVVTEALGTITVTSAPGAGSRFTVYWPRAEAPAADVPPVTLVSPEMPAAGAPPLRPAPATRTSPTLPAVPLGGRTILLVDDDESVRRVMAMQLEANGFRVHSADSAAAALVLLRRGDLAIHAMVTDVRMPEMSGIELVAQMMADGIEIPVVLVSGQLDAQLPRDWPPSPYRSFMPKPISGVMLRRTLEELMASFEAIEAVPQA